MLKIKVWPVWERQIEKIDKFLHSMITASFPDTLARNWMKGTAMTQTSNCMVFKAVV